MIHDVIEYEIEAGRADEQGRIKIIIRPVLKYITVTLSFDFKDKHPATFEELDWE